MFQTFCDNRCCHLKQHDHMYKHMYIFYHLWGHLNSEKADYFLIGKYTCICNRFQGQWLLGVGCYHVLGFALYLREQPNSKVSGSISLGLCNKISLLATKKWDLSLPASNKDHSLRRKQKHKGATRRKVRMRCTFLSQTRAANVDWDTALFGKVMTPWSYKAATTWPYWSRTWQ